MNEPSPPLSSPLVIRDPGRASVHPAAMITSLIRHRQLIVQLTGRELAGRFRGSWLGPLWLGLQPLFMLAVYTFALGYVLKARWGEASNDSPLTYALFLYTGLLTFSIFAETVSRAPTILLENTSFIKKMLFPIEILPVVPLAAALVNFVIGFGILLILRMIIAGPPPLTALLVPLPLIPLVLLTLGLSWFLAALGIFLRDLRQLISVTVSALLFLSPIFYPLSILPDWIRPIMALNPLAPIVGTMRDLLFFGRLPDWWTFGLSVAFCALVAWLGFVWFNKTRRGFADVL